MKKIHRLVLAVLASFSAAASQSAEPALQNVIGLSASASVDVTKDLLSVTLSTTRDGNDAATVQAGLKQALDAALAEAKKSAKSGQIDVQTGNFSMYPRYAAKGGINGWQGSAELVVEGRDIPGIAQLVGRINTLTIARVGTNLSREQREKVEADVAAQAIDRYRAKASEYARQFGFTGFSLREVTVNTSEPGGFVPMMMQAKGVARMAADETLPVELGKSTVSVTVNGTVQLNK